MVIRVLIVLFVVMLEHGEIVQVIQFLFQAITAHTITATTVVRGARMVKAMWAIVARKWQQQIHVQVQPCIQAKKNAALALMVVRIVNNAVLKSSLRIVIGIVLIKKANSMDVRCLS